MKKIALLMVVVVAALLISSLAFAQTYEKVIKMSEGMGEGMHKQCSKMADVKVVKGMAGCAGNITLPRRYIAHTVTAPRATDKSRTKCQAKAQPR